MAERFTIGKNDINDIYSRIRVRHQRELADNRSRLYEKIPGLRELEQEETEVNTSSILEMIHLSPEQVVKLKADRKQKLRELGEKKRSMLLANGESPDALTLSYDCPVCMDEGTVDGRRCDCYKKHLLGLLYRQSSLGDVLERENFDTFSLDYYSPEKWDDVPSPRANMSSKLEKAKDFANHFDNSGKSILLYGEAGVGKTFLSNCIAKQLMEDGHTVLYVSANELFEEILSPYIMSSDPDAREMLRPVYELVYQSELLILDDLGTELTNSFTISQLFEIINRRMNAHHSTIISTNLSLEQMKDRYQDRIVSRIIERYEIFKIYGKNIRSIKKTGKY